MRTGKPDNARTNGGIWQPAPPASETALAALREQAPTSLPAAYLAQLAVSDGGEGDLGVEPGWIAVWPCEEVISSNAGYSVPEFLRGFVGFGSNGGGELLAFDLRGEEPYPIVMVPLSRWIPRKQFGSLPRSRSCAISSESP
jgi:hypothetical protein